jgi:hypothetical protein
MRPAVLERVLWGAAVVIAAGALAWTRAAATAATTAGAPTIRAAPTGPRQLAADSLANAATYIVTNDPFRLARSPSSVAYSPALEGVAPPPETKPARPNLVLRGIIGGPPWSAILEGIPGREGSVVLRRGDTLAALRVRAVRRDTVVIEGADTTWHLTVKRTW